MAGYSNVTICSCGEMEEYWTWKFENSFAIMTIVDDRSASKSCPSETEILLRDTVIANYFHSNYINFWCCYNEVPHSGWLKQPKLLSHLRRSVVGDQSVGRVSLLRSVRDVPFLCLTFGSLRVASHLLLVHVSLSKCLLFIRIRAHPNDFTLTWSFAKTPFPDRATFTFTGTGRLRLHHLLEGHNSTLDSRQSEWVFWEFVLAVLGLELRASSLLENAFLSIESLHQPFFFVLGIFKIGFLKLCPAGFKQRSNLYLLSS
jgi:hypothetical protein